MEHLLDRGTRPSRMRHQRLAALVFLFRKTLGRPEAVSFFSWPKDAERLPVVLSPEAAARLLAVMHPADRPGKPRGDPGGGREGALTDQDLRQPPGQLRPALKLDLRGLTSLASSRDGHILFTGAGMAATDPSQVDRLESRLIQRVSNRGIPGLPPGVQRHVQGFLMDPFRAQVWLKHLEWNLQVQYPTMLEAWDAHLQGKPAALPGRAAVEPKGFLGGSRGESKVESEGDSKRHAGTHTGAGAGFQPIPESPSLELPDPGMEFPDPE